ncbi:MAG: hypothetical protein IKT08_03180 [Bacteroidales bacterium]|nr:hypothetical protein [Bacteroidales bacterium]
MHTCRHFFRAILLTVSVVLCMVAWGQNDLPLGDNLVVNGDFEQGNTGFESNYTYTTGQITSSGRYCIDTEVGSHYPSGSPAPLFGQGHSGKYMIINGSGVADDIVWQETIEVTQHTDYVFSVWVAHLYKAYTENYKAQLDFYINGVKLNNTPFINSCANNNQRPNWQEYTTNWNSGTSTTAQITIYDINTNQDAGNDFGLDDISLRERLVTEISATDCGSYEWEGDIYTVSGDYTKTLTTPGGVEYTVTLHLTILDDMSVTVAADDDELCEGESTTLHTVVPPVAFYAPGDILCTDGSIVKPSAWPVAGKTAKGIVFYVDASGQHGWAVDKDITHSLYDTSQPELVKWGSNNSDYWDVPNLYNYEQWKDAIKDFDGYSNTQIIRDYTFVSTNDPRTFPAAWSVDFEHDWYIPAAGQLNVLFGEILVVNSSLNLSGIGGTPISPDGEMWSSTEFSSPDYTYVRALKIQMNGNISTGRILHEEKKQKKTLRAVIDF